MTKTRRTQAERRAETRAALLESACRLFGSKGYAQTSLEEIATACGLTIRPIYHYFGNKLALFTAVNDVMEERIVASMHRTEEDASPALAGWRAFLELCRDSEFRQIALIDAPNVLGRRRMTETPVTRTADALIRRRTREASDRATHLATRMQMAALAEAALTIAESDDPEQLSREADELVSKMFDAFDEEPIR